MARTKSHFGLVELVAIIALVAIFVILYMLYTREDDRQDVVVLERESPEYIPVFFGGRRGGCSGPGPCLPKQPAKGPKLPPGSPVPVPQPKKVPVPPPKKVPLPPPKKVPEPLES